MTPTSLGSARTSPRGRCPKLSLLFLAVVALVLGACTARAPQPTHMVYVKPGARLDRYAELVVDPFMISYERGPRSTGFAVLEPQPSRTLDREAEVEFAGAARKAFVQSMRRGRHYSVVEEPGPETLHVQGWIFDLVLGESKPRYLPICDSKMTLIMTVRDAQTAEALARVSHRFPLRCERRPFLVDPDWDDLTRALQPWASLLRRHLDDLHGLEATSRLGPARSAPVAALPLSGFWEAARS